MVPVTQKQPQSNPKQSKCQQGVVQLWRGEKLQYFLEIFSDQHRPQLGSKGRKNICIHQQKQHQWLWHCGIQKRHPHWVDKTKWYKKDIISIYLSPRSRTTPCRIDTDRRQTPPQAPIADSSTKVSKKMMKHLHWLSESKYLIPRCSTAKILVTVLSMNACFRRIWEMRQLT